MFIYPRYVATAVAVVASGASVASCCTPYKCRRGRGLETGEVEPPREDRLSTEFRRRFQREKKKPNESFVEFSCGLRDNLTEWIKGSDADGNFPKLRDLICLERFYETLPERKRFWVKDRQVGVSENKAVQLAVEYIANRSFKEGKVSQDAPGLFEEGKLPSGGIESVYGSRQKTTGSQ